MMKGWVKKVNMRLIDKVNEKLYTKNIFNNSLRMDGPTMHLIVLKNWNYAVKNMKAWVRHSVMVGKIDSNWKVR